MKCKCKFMRRVCIYGNEFRVKCWNLQISLGEKPRFNCKRSVIDQLGSITPAN